MKVVDAIAHILKKEGVRILFAYPLNPIIEAAAKLDIRTVIVRQERVGLHMADSLSRMSSGQQIGVFCMQHGPGSENSFGGVAQAYSESSPIVVLPMGYPRTLSQVQPNFHSALNYRHVTKSCEQLLVPQAVPDAMRRAFSAARNGRPRPALVEIPGDLMHEEGADPMSYRPTVTARYGPAPEEVRKVAEVLIAAERPVIYAGQGIHYAQAWAELKELAELLEAPVTTSLSGKSAFPENHPLYLGCANRAYPKTVKDHLYNADVIFAIGCSLSTTSFGIPLPRGKRYIHATLDPADINKDVASEIALIGDARLTLQALAGEISDRLRGRPRGLSHVATGDPGGQGPMVGPVDAQTHVQRGASVALPGDLGSLAHRGCGQYDRHPRRGQPTGPDDAVLGSDDAALIHRLGEDNPVGLWFWFDHGREAGSTGKTLHQRLGRRCHRLHGHGLRNGSARADPDPVGSPQQLLHGVRNTRHACFHG